MESATALSDPLHHADREPPNLSRKRNRSLILPHVLTINPHLDDIEAPAAAFLARVYDGRHPHTMSRSVRGGVDPVAMLPEGFAIERTHLNGSDRTVCASSADGDVTLLIAGETGVTTLQASAVRAADLRALEELFEPPGHPEQSDFVDINFWYQAPNGPERHERSVDCANWSDIKANYPSATRAALDRVMSLERPTEAESGSLILWHGPPGTGKTNAVRALTRSWSGWSETHVISDPERFFDQTSYLLEVMLRAPERHSSGDGRPWLLIVCEDADEYLRSDARQRSGAALGRLLNATDGLLGRGLGVVVLLTTNDDLGRLHPAVTRAGRCLSTAEFVPFSASEADAWLADSHLSTGETMTLADLYELRSGSSHRNHREPELMTGAYL